MGYETYRIADLIDEIAMGPFGSNIKVSCFVDSGVPVLNGSNLEGFSLSEKTFRYVTREKADSLNKANAHRGDIVITHRGTLGQIVFIPQDSKYDRYVISQSQFRVRCNDKVLPEYLVYYFHTPIGQHKLLSNASQVGVPALARPSSTFQQIEVVLPELSIQKRVVEIISTIQKKIVNNQELNDNLEQQAQAIYHERFETVSPNEYMPVGEVCSSISDTYREKKNMVTLINTSDVLEGRVLNHERVPNSNLKGQFKKTFQRDDILYSEIRPQNRRFAYVDFSPIDYIASTKLMVIRAKKDVVSPKYLYYFLKNSSTVAELQLLAETRSGTFPQITFSEVANLTIPVPSLAVQEVIVQTMQCLEDKITCNEQINDNLAA